MTKGERIRQAREAAGISQEELAQAAGTIKQTIYKYERGIVTNIPWDRVERMAARLGVSSAYIMGWIDTPTPEAEPSVTPEQRDLLALLDELTPAELSVLSTTAQALKAARQGRGNQE